MTDARAALDAIGELPDSEIDIADAAVQLARMVTPDADWRAARAHLSLLAREAVKEAGDVAADDLRAQATALKRLIAGRHRYRGDSERYDDPANANLIRVIERRKGLPVALGIIWLHAAHASGWNAYGVDFPGHFLVALSGRGEQLVLDVFNGGGTMDARDLRVLIKEFEGDKAELRPGLLRPMSSRAVLMRLQNNIRQRRLAAKDLGGALDCTETMLRIAPDSSILWKEAALMNQRLDRVSAALRCFERFLTLVPQGDQAVRARAAMDELRSRLN
jgi:regulator of sirC expression with transglutaminase-like and TPR domain